MRWMLVLLPVLMVPPPDLFAQPPPQPPQELELGVFEHLLSDDLGPWTVAQARYFWNPPRVVRPVIDFEYQDRRDIRGTRVGGGAYVDWSDSFYSYQTISFSRAPSIDRAVYPRRRLDVRAFMKIPPRRAVVATAGYTNLTFGSPQSTNIYSTGVLIYTGSTIAEITLFANRNDPGALWSTAATVAVQRGRAGRRWYGASVSGGNELYRVGERPEALIADFNTATVAVFLRQWLTTNGGVHVTAEYQRAIGFYERVGIGARWFVQF